MNHQRHHRLQLVIAAILFLIHGMTLGQDRERENPPVSWVNSKLPDGPGLTHHILNSKFMGHEVGYVVWTPDGFDKSGATRYPVIYFLHGIGGTESADSAGFSGHVAEAIKIGDMPPVICVFPNGGRSGHRGEVETMIIAELIPLIDHDYPTKATAAGCMVVGFSMGGAGAVRLSLLHPGLFAGAGSWGGGLWRDADQLVEAAGKAAATFKANGFGFLLVNGEKDRPDAYKALTEKLTELHIPYEVTVIPDTPHNLGLYYERNARQMMQFIGNRLKAAAN